MPCVMNAANEVAVQRFIDGSIGFLDIADFVEQSMESASFIPEPSLEDLFQTDKTVRNQ